MPMTDTTPCSACGAPIKRGTGHYNFDGRPFCGHECWREWVQGRVTQARRDIDKIFEHLDTDLSGGMT